MSTLDTMIITRSIPISFKEILQASMTFKRPDYDSIIRPVTKAQVIAFETPNTSLMMLDLAENPNVDGGN